MTSQDWTSIVTWLFFVVVLGLGLWFDYCERKGKIP